MYQRYIQLGRVIFTGLRFDAEKRNFGVLISQAIISPNIEKEQERRLHYTNYNRHTVKWFKLKQINPAQRQTIISFRYRYEKLEDRPLIGGRWTVYDNAAEIVAGINLEVNDKRKIVGKASLISVEADWASGILGFAQNIFDILMGSIGWLTTGDFVRLTDMITSITPLVANLSLEERLKIMQPFSKINELNRKNLIYLNSIDYDPEGLWLMFKLDEARIQESLAIIKSLI